MLLCTDGGWHAHHLRLFLLPGRQSGWPSGIDVPIQSAKHVCRRENLWRICPGEPRNTEGRVLESYFVQPQRLGVAFGKKFALRTPKEETGRKCPCLVGVRCWNSELPRCSGTLLRPDQEPVPIGVSDPTGRRPRSGKRWTNLKTTSLQTDP